MKSKIIVIAVILCMCVVVGTLGALTLKNSNSVFKQSKKIIDWDQKYWNNLDKFQ